MVVEDGKGLCNSWSVCELVLLTLGNEEQTRTKRIEGGTEGWERGK